VGDLDGRYANLQQRQAAILHPPRATPYGIREMVVEDLNG
jgi:hypothetical protein